MTAVIDEIYETVEPYEQQEDDCSAFVFCIEGRRFIVNMPNKDVKQSASSLIRKAIQRQLTRIQEGN